MSTKFERDTSVARTDGGGFEAGVDDAWWIALGPNGGYLAAIVIRALISAVGDEARKPRSLTIHYTAAPEAGPVRIETNVEREGRSLSTVTARMHQRDRLIAVAIGALATDRERRVDFDDTTAPDVPPPEQLPPIPANVDLPVFTKQWDFRPAIGGMPFAGGDTAETGGWIRLNERQAIDYALVAQLTDAWLPAVFTRLTGRNAVPTVDLTIHFRADLPLPDDWVLVRFTSRLSAHGFLEEDGEIWSRDGTLIAQSRQLALLQAPSQE
jgi:acyl-CoA thioesterase